MTGAGRGAKLLLLVVLLVSLGARAAWLGAPCHRACRTGSAHVLVFDESYYVNAARRIAGVSVGGRENYARTPAGLDPNSEHPQLVKLLIAGGIELFGDGPLAWRLPSLFFGTLALLGLWLVAGAAGARPGEALSAVALMASDNLLLVHGRIGTLDIAVTALALLAVAAWLRGAPALAGLLVGVGACAKLVAPYALVVIALLALAARLPWRTALRRLVLCGGCAAGALLGGLWLMDAVAAPYDPGARRQVGGGPLGHLHHMLSFAARQTSPHGPRGIASYPWTWWADVKPIVYLNVDAHHPAPGLLDVHPNVHFLGVASPPILLLALPALGACLWRRRRRRRAEAGAGAGVADADAVALAWVTGTWTPLALASLLLARTSYLYYMVPVMPGVHLAVARLVGRVRAPRTAWLRRAWWAAVLVACALMYPLTPL